MIVDAVFRTISCDGNCGKTVTFAQQDAEKTVKENDWIQGIRMVTAGDGRKFAYCTDECEVKGVTTGSHNLPVAKVIDIATGTNAMKQAAALAAAKAQSDLALKAPNS